MIDQDENPYASPATVPEPQSKPRSYKCWCALVSWGLLAGALWLLKPPFATIYSDFELELPTITVLVLNPLLPLGIAMVGVALFVAFLTEPEDRERRWLTPLSILLGGALAGFIVLALFLPLISPITPLN